MISLYDSNHALPVIVLRNDTAVLRAAKDLLRDFRRLSGDEGRTDFSLLVSENAPVIPGDFGPALYVSVGENPFFEAPKTPESYLTVISDERIVIAGSDPLGAVYGIYDFEKECLGLDPLMQFTDYFPATRTEIRLEAKTLEKGAPKVRFRGWFINDEDLLSDFRGGDGSRNIAYKYYDHVIREDVFDMVLETALRTGYNMIIPSTFVNIMNPFEERLVRQSFERGLYITQHHIEPLGVSHFGAQAYMEKTGIAGPFSFLTNRYGVLAVWRAYIRAWKPYASRVVWQLGLRGATDVPVWVTDGNVPNTNEAHGAIIGDAIHSEYRLLKEELGEGFVSTATLWHEGAALYGGGYLSIPEETTVVFSDVGFDQLYSNDFYAIKRNPEKTYGVYQHCAFWSKGPHNAEGIEPEKLVFSCLEAYRTGSLSYTVMNVTNVRPMVNSIALHGEVLKDPASWLNAPDEKLNAFLSRFYRFYFGALSENVRSLRAEYFASMADLGEEEAMLNYHRHAFDFHAYEKLPFRRFLASDGEILYWGNAPYRKGALTLYPHPIYDWTRDLFQESASHFSALLEKIRALAPEIEKNCPEAYEYYVTNLYYQTVHMLRLTEWVLKIREIRESRFVHDRVPVGEEGVRIIEDLLRERAVLEHGKWAGWCRGDKKQPIGDCIPKTRAYAKEGNILNLDKYR